MTMFTTQQIAQMLADAANVANDIRGVESTSFGAEQRSDGIYLTIHGDRWTPNCAMKLPKFMTLDDAQKLAVTFGTVFSSTISSVIASNKATVKQVLLDIGNSL